MKSFASTCGWSSSDGRRTGAHTPLKPLELLLDVVEGQGAEHGIELADEGHAVFGAPRYVVVAGLSIRSGRPSRVQNSSQKRSGWRHTK